MTMENKKVCTQCHNQCPVDALKCGRGKAFFGEEGKMAADRGGEGNGREGHGGNGHGKDGHGRGPSFNPDSLYGLMRGCGHYLHHSQGNGCPDESVLFGALDEQERDELKRLLAKVLNSWN